MSSPSPSRVLVIGLDGATWTNLLPLAERGDMPTLRRLMKEGSWGNLESTIPALTPPAWASLVTGTNPGKHGIYHFRHTPAGDYYQRRLNTSRDIRSPSEFRRPRLVGSRQRNDLAARILAECWDENRSPVITSDDTNSDHRRVSVGRCSGPAPQARVGGRT